MRNYISYLRYVVKHKYFVWKAGRKMNVPVWRLLVHDLSKLLPYEWFPYMNTFYTWDGKSRYQPHYKFDYAWNCHQKRNKHHWQYWILIKDDGKENILDIPLVYVAEMVADWAGAGKAITGKWEIVEWYGKNKDKMKLSRITRIRVEKQLDLYWK